MSVRAAYEIDDIQRCIVKLLDAITATPISDAEIVFGYPEADRFLKFEKAIIYVLEPFQIGKSFQQGGLPVEKEYEIAIGIWTDANTGGIEEANLICSYLLDFFNDKKKSHSTQKFTVVLGSTTYASTDLLAQGIRIQDISGPRTLVANTDLKEHRKELTLNILI